MGGTTVSCVQLEVAKAEANRQIDATLKALTKLGGDASYWMAIQDALPAE